jgi:hypothetical protein
MNGDRPRTPANADIETPDPDDAVAICSAAITESLTRD